MLVKICGIIREEDAQEAVRCGANALGFVFWPESPRRVEPVRARAIVRTLPPFVTAVGVFVNQTTDDMNAIADEVGLGAIQLHGDELPEQADRLERPVIKSVAIGAATAEAIDVWPTHRLLLLDAHDPVQRGGTGRVVDWAKAAALAARRPILLAGGLTPANVEDAIASVRPYGVDVSSGVEASPGRKDHAKLGAFFDGVARAVSWWQTGERSLRVENVKEQG
jgi:phosphoribosylanthranilate isomerase